MYRLGTWFTGVRGHRLQSPEESRATEGGTLKALLAALEQAFGNLQAEDSGAAVRSQGGSEMHSSQTQ